MNKTKSIKTVAVIFGGASSEHKISLLSAYSVLKNIDTNLFEVVKVGITQKGVWFVYEGEIEKIKDGTWETDIENLIPAVISPCTVQHGLFLFDKKNMSFTSKRIDVAFPLIHGKGGEDGSLQGLFTLANIPFVGCGILSSACCMDKAVSKEICEREGIDVVPWLYALKRASFDLEKFITQCEEKLSYPMFVKPSREGSSFGTAKAKDRKELLNAIENAFLLDDKILVEKYVKCREVELAALENENSNIFVSSPGEIIPLDFYDYASKYENDTASLQVPANFDDNTKNKLKAMAKKVFEVLQCKGFSRIDFFVDGEKIYFNEINTIPGFTHISMYPKLLEYDGVSYTELITRLIGGAEV